MTQSSTIFDDFCFPEIKSCAFETTDAKRNPIMIINSIKLVQLPFWNLSEKLFDERQTRIKIMKLYSFECDGENMQNHFICKNGEERNFFPCQRNLQSHKFLLLSDCFHTDKYIFNWILMQIDEFFPFQLNNFASNCDEDCSHSAGAMLAHLH